jgi:predicted peptidase
MRTLQTLIALSVFIVMTGCTSTKEWTVERGQHPRHIEITIVKTVAYDLLVYVPQSYTTVDKRWPLIVFLHGSGERGNDPAKLKIHSLPKFLDSVDEFPFIVVSPQCPDNERWNAEALNAMLDDVIARLPIDTNRIYLTGLSMGGFGTWKLAIAYPQRFAAIAPVCGWGHLEDVGVLKEKPVWVFHGAKDNVVPPSESEKMVEFLKKHGSTKVKYTMYPDANHNAWDQTYSNPELYEWFLQHSLRETGNHKNP